MNILLSGSFLLFYFFYLIFTIRFKSGSFVSLAVSHSDRINIGDSGRINIRDSSRINIGDSSRINIGDSSRIYIGDSGRIYVGGVRSSCIQGITISYFSTSMIATPSASKEIPSADRSV